MIARLWCRIFGHAYRTQASFQARGNQPAVVVQTCRCGLSAVIPARIRGRV